MPEHLRALVWILLIATFFFYVAQGAFAELLSEQTFKRWRNLWFASTLALFLSHSIWIAMLVTGAMLLVQRRKEAHVMGLYFALLFVAPPAPAMIPGMGIVNHLWVIDHYRLLALCLLLPAALTLSQRKSTFPMGSSRVDTALIGYFGVLCLLAFREGNVTDGMRTVLTLFVDILLPYYVASRSIKNKDGFHQAATGFVMGAALLCLLLIFEVLRHWRLYSGVVGALGLNPNLFGNYLLRSGFLRPTGSVGNSIVAGYVVMVALGLFLYLKNSFKTRRYRLMGGALLAGGLVASLSRGPWVGAAILLFTFLITGPHAFKKISKLSVLGAAGLALLTLHPTGQVLIDLLPIIGEAEQGNLEYRADLLGAALPVIERNLLLGSENFLDAPELQVMRQGEGIIDIVNSYIGVALHAGLLGLALFISIFVTATLEAKRGINLVRTRDSEAAILGRALFAILIAIAFVIYTVSSIFAVATVYWSIIGMTVAFRNYANGEFSTASNASKP